MEQDSERIPTAQPSLISPARRVGPPGFSSGTGFDFFTFFLIKILGILSRKESETAVPLDTSSGSGQLVLTCFKTKMTLSVVFGPALS